MCYNSPSITSGVEILKQNNTTHSNYDNLVCNTISYIFKTTSETVDISGNLADSNWNHITYYKID